MKKIALEYEEILTMPQDAAGAEMESKEALRKKVLVAFNAVNLGIVEMIIKGAIRAIDLKRNLAAERRMEIFALLSREEGVFATFKEARQMVKEFLDETSYPRVKDAYDRAQEAAGALEGQMLTPGQKDDAKDFGAALENELAKVFRNAGRRLQGIRTEARISLLRSARLRLLPGVDGRGLLEGPFEQVEELEARHRRPATRADAGMQRRSKGAGGEPRRHHIRRQEGDPRAGSKSIAAICSPHGIDSRKTPRIPSGRSKAVST